jgi:peptidoglycan/xylan/chitin deacetylase (PgdA/CDA1 family)
MVKPPQYLKWLYPGVTWNIKTTEKVLYLTFDDGPIPEVTPLVLDLLKQFDAKATFFCIGDNVQKHPPLFNDVLNAGHGIGNHTFHHYNAWKVPQQTFMDDVEDAKKVIESNLFRPPYGKLTPMHIRKLKRDFKIIMWDVISCDFDTKVNKEIVYQNVVNNATNGSIIVFHDSLKAAPNLLYALPKVLHYFSDRGYKFESLD